MQPVPNPARIKALLRRPGGVLGMTLEAGNVRLDTVGRELTVGGSLVSVSRGELSILEQMMRRFGRIVPKPCWRRSFAASTRSRIQIRFQCTSTTCGANWRRRAPR
jgi:DNA-binding response OmpR family regulator